MNNDYRMGNYFDENISIIDQKAEELKDECLLEFDNFQNPATVNDLQGVATMIHSLMFLVPGTYPDCPEMGIAIQDYQFEILDDNMISKIRTKITDQINKYLPSITVRNIIVKKFNNDSLRKTIGIGFDIGIGRNSSDDASKQFFLTLEEKPESRELISRIIY